MELLSKSLVLKSAANRSFLVDIFLSEEKSNNWIVFCHGYKGFKDWGAWKLMGTFLAKNKYNVALMNFSHNGTSVENPHDLHDMEAFGNNNFSKELMDLNCTINHIKKEYEVNHLTLMGHSRGGGLAVIAAAQNKNIDALVTLAAVASLDYAWRGNKDLVKKWKEKGVFNVYNARIKKEMPNYFQLYEDYQANEAIYNADKVAPTIQKPTLIIHGAKDPGIPATAAHTIQGFIKYSLLYIIKDADHVFGAHHPYTSEKLPLHLEVAMKKTIWFLDPIVQKKKEASSK